MDIKIIVATHKTYWMPEDTMYVPVHVGHAGKADLGYQPDDTGDNISSRNANYCELTGLYWAWKNLNCDYLGLVHYRRHFALHVHGRDKKKGILSRSQCECLLADIDADTGVLLPKPRNYLIETNYSQYVHAHHKEDLDITRAILAEKYPQYIQAFDKSMRQTTGHRFNMFIMKKETADSYCEWLFDVLFELEKRLDISGYSRNDARVFGFVSERLLDVYILTNHLHCHDLPYVFLEKQNWFVKGGAFLKRKFLPREVKNSKRG